MKNYYTILQLPECANQDEVRDAYRRLAKEYHPDVNKSPDANEKFCEITEAYEFIMNHWPLHVNQYAKRTSYEQKYSEYRQTEDYHRFRKEIHEKAHQQAKMRYEKFKRQHEAFQESGIDDIVLLLKIIVRIISIFLFLILLLLPLLAAYLVNWRLLSIGIISWPLAGVIVWNFYNNRKDYFLPGKFYYSPDRIKHLYVDKHTSMQQCYYCHKKSADSKPYKLDLLKLKEVKFKFGGYRQHYVNYVNQNISILVPRSQKAFIVHSINILLKVLSVFCCLSFLSISSMVWRFIIGMVLGGTLSTLHLLISITKSNVSYILSYGLVVRIAIWILCIALVSRFYTKPFDISTNDLIYFVISAILIFDSFLMQFIGFALGKYSSKPMRKQYPETANKIKEGFIVHNDIPVISVVYPMYKWVFG